MYAICDYLWSKESSGRADTYPIEISWTLDRSAKFIHQVVEYCHVVLLSTSESGTVTAASKELTLSYGDLCSNEVRLGVSFKTFFEQPPIRFSFQLVVPIWRTLHFIAMYGDLTPVAQVLNTHAYQVHLPIPNEIDRATYWQHINTLVENVHTDHLLEAIYAAARTESNQRWKRNPQWRVLVDKLRGYHPDYQHQSQWFDLEE